MSVAYWGPEIKVGVPQPALNVEHGRAHQRRESLSFTLRHRREDAAGRLHPGTDRRRRRFPIPIPDITPLNPPLGLIPPIPKHIEPIDGTAKYSPMRAALIGLAKAAQSADAVTGDRQRSTCCATAAC